jgi:Na+-translocating ferredoxin:NAD+ oxidoreductase RnfD subunit
VSAVASTSRPSPAAHPLRRFFRRPKGLLILILVGLTAIAAAGNGFALVAPGLTAACVVAMLIDAPILRWREKKWVIPDGAFLSGLIVALILSPHEPWHVTAITSAIAVLSKYVLRTKTANIFNPAALALLANYLLFQSGQSWWGALPELSPLSFQLAALAALIATGLLVADRVNRLPAVLAFLGAYYLLFTITAFVGDPVDVAGIYRGSDLHAALFFALFMVTDPPTSPPKYRDQVIFGVMVAVLAYAINRLAAGIYYLLIALLVANVWEAWRRWRTHHSRK